jgi:hypothetical protein
MQAAEGGEMRVKIKKFIVTAAAAFVMATAVALTMKAMRPKQPEPPPVDNLPQAVVVYCFQANQRSAKCEKIERLMHELLVKSFSTQLKNRKIVWQVVNFEEPENTHLADEYHVTSTSIVVVDGREGSTAPAVNYQQKVWALADNKEAFAKYFRDEIEKALKQQGAGR